MGINPKLIWIQREEKSAELEFSLHQDFRFPEIKRIIILKIKMIVFLETYFW